MLCEADFKTEKVFIDMHRKKLTNGLAYLGFALFSLSTKSHHLKAVHILPFLTSCVLLPDLCLQTIWTRICNFCETPVIWIMSAPTF